MKKVAGIIALVIMISFLAFFVFFQNYFGNNEGEETTDKTKKILETYKTEIIVYGDEVELDEHCTIRKIDALTKENLDLDEEFMYTYLIINDLSGELTMSDNDFEILYDKCYNDKLCFFYLGENYLENFREAEIFVQPLKDTDMSLGVVYERGVIMDVLGTWTKDLHNDYINGDTHLLKEMLMYEIISTIEVDNME